VAKPTVSFCALIICRHLSESQRAYIAAELATLKLGNVKAQKSGGQICPSTEEAATMLNVSPRSVKNAKVVRDHGTEEEKAAVKPPVRSQPERLRGLQVVRVPAKSSASVRAPMGVRTAIHVA
jgi:hypothetical protein